MAPPEYREWLDKKLYNAPSLYEKLKLLAAQPDQQVVQALLPNVEMWARRTSDAHNDLAHRGESTRVPGAEMAAAVSVTVAVVVINLLDQLDIPPKRLIQAPQHHPDLKDAPLLAQKHWPGAHVRSITWIAESSNGSAPRLERTDFHMLLRVAELQRSDENR